MDQEPDLVVSAGFSDAKLAAEVNKVVGKFAAAGKQAQEAFNKTAEKAVENSQIVRANTRELDRLKRAYDPLYAASKRYEGELKRLDRALDVGAINQKQYADQVGLAAREMNVASGAIAGATKNFAGGGNTMQQLGWQIGDFATQVGAGTSAVQAFGQQAPQMLGAFGTWGALAGAAVAIAVPLGAALLKMAFDTETLDEKLEKLNETTDEYTSLAERAADPIEVLRQRYGSLADEVQRANSTMAMLASIQAKSDLFGASRSLSGGLGIDLNRLRPDPSQLAGITNPDRLRVEAAAQVEAQAEAMKKLAEKTGASADQAERLRMALNRTDSSNSLEATAKDAENLLSIIAELSVTATDDQRGFLSGWATQVSAVMTAAQAQIKATRSEFERVADQYETDTEKLKKLSNDRKVAEEAVANAIRERNAEAVVIANERLELIDAELAKTRQLALANDELFQAMQKRLKAALPGFIDNAVEAATGTTLTQWGSYGESANKGILDLIAKVESGGDYNATLDNGRWTGGAKNLVNMTLKEVRALQESMKTPENRAIYGDGDGSSALGRYQIVGTTLDGLMKRLKLSGDELFSPEMQDRLANELLRQIKTGDVSGIRNVWAGLENVPDPLIQKAWGQQSIERVDPEVQRAREAEIKDRERIAEQAAKYGEQLAQNLLTERESSKLAASQADQIAAIKSSGLDPEAEARAIAAVTAETERQRTVMMLMADAKRRNVDLDAMLTDGSMTYRQAIEALGEAKRADIIASNDRAIAEGRAAEAQQFMASQQDQFKNGLLDAIIAGESFTDVLANLAQAFARAALQAALFGEGPMAGGGGGGGLLGGLIGGIFGGFRANGGPVRAGVPYFVNENTTNSEVVVPSQSGGVLNVPQAQAALRQSSGGANGSRSVALTIDLRGTTGDRELDAKIARAGRQILAQVPSVMDDVNKRTR